MLVRCLAMMRGGGETRHLAWARELTALGVEVDIIAGRPLLFGGPRYPSEAGMRVTLLRSPYTRDFVYRHQHQRGFGRLTMTVLHAVMSPFAIVDCQMKALQKSRWSNRAEAVSEPQ